MSESYLEVEGARVHNLKNISVRIPKSKMTVITGLSGSGKSSLAFDTIYAEGQRRYLDSFSAFARQFMGQIERPDVDRIAGLSPVISIEQKTIGRNPRSTVGTITEVYDFMRLLFARASVAYSYETGKRMIHYSEGQISELISSDYLGKKIIILAPIVRGRKGHYRELFEQMSKLGFVRVRVDGEVQEIRPKMQVDRYKIHDIEVVIDRLSVKAEDHFRVSESVARAMKLGDGLMAVLDLETNMVRWFSKNLMCEDTGISYEEPSPNTFSFNSPYGYCYSCKGMGVKYEIDEDSIFPDKSLTLQEGALAPMSHNKESGTYSYFMSMAKSAKIPLNKPIKDLNPSQIQMMLYGTEGKQVIENKSASMPSTSLVTFEGVASMLQRWFEESESDYIRDWASQYMKLLPCDVCHGSRLKKEATWFRVHEKSIYDLAQMDIEVLAHWFMTVNSKLDKRQKLIAKDILKEINDRLGFLLDVGLHYLTLDRAAGTLSGGESQRIRLATQIGSKLSGITYILDEPSIGLHQDDNHKLIVALQKLRDIGNTVIIVEHDKDIMKAADYVIDIGPGAGLHGGYIGFEGTPEEMMKSESLTSLYVQNKKSISIPDHRRTGSGHWLKLNGAKGNNLKNVNLKIPLGTLTVVTGLSGSGKSTLIGETLYPLLMQHCYKSKLYPLKYKSIEGLDNIDKVIEIDQSPIGRTPRSNPATYTQLFSDIRSIFSNLPDSKIRGYKPGRFSFNVKGGRCEDCKGDGMQKVEMNFLPDVYVKCQTCHGKRYNKATLEVRYKGLSISDVLDLPVSEAVDFFKHIPILYRKLKTLDDVGLGYIKLGQSSTTLSGGEAQRVKLATELSKRDTGKSFYILDEPTTGLHFQDIDLLTQVLQKLVDKGNTVLVIEHNMDIIKIADYIIDLGPGGGKKGGEIVAEGTPESVTKIKKSVTGKYLKTELL